MTGPPQVPQKRRATGVKAEPGAYASGTPDSRVKQEVPTPQQRPTPPQVSTPPPTPQHIPTPPQVSTPPQVPTSQEIKTQPQVSTTPPELPPTQVPAPATPQVSPPPPPPRLPATPQPRIFSPESPTMKVKEQEAATPNTSPGASSTVPGPTPSVAPSEIGNKRGRDGDDDGELGYFLTLSVPPPQLSHGAIDARLRRVFKKRADGTYQLDDSWNSQWKDQSQRKNLFAMFEKLGYDTDWV